LADGAPSDVTNGANTSVSPQPEGLYRTVKAGSDGWNAYSRGWVAISGDFALRMRPLENNKHATAGVTWAPGASPTNTHADITYGYSFAGGSLRTETGTNVTLGTYTAGENFWITRVGSTISWYRGATLEAAIAAGALRTITGSTAT